MEWLVVVYVTQRRILALAIIVGMSFGLLTYQVSSYMVLSEINGVPVSDTVFANLPRDGKMPVFDMTGMVSKNETYFIDSTLWDMPLIPSSEAIDIAFEFLRANFNETQLESAGVEWTALVGDEPTWVVTIHGSIGTQIYVNAITGDLVAWNLSTLSLGAPGPYYENNSIISPAIAEKSAFDFLAHNNYSIPSNARYIGVNEYPSDRNNYYVVFRHYEGQFPVGWVVTDSDINPDQSYEGIILRVNERTAEVTQLGFRWTKVDPPPVIGVVPEWQAQSAVKDYYASENVSIVYSGILLTRIFSLKSSDGSDQIHLAWRIGVIKDAILVWLFVDAYTGNVIDEESTNGAGPLVTTNAAAEPSSPVVVVIAGLSVGVVVALSSRYLLRKRYLYIE